MAIIWLGITILCAYVTFKHSSDSRKMTRELAEQNDLLRDAMKEVEFCRKYGIDPDKQK